MGERDEGGNTDDGDAQAKADTAGEGNAHAQSRKRPGSNSDRHHIERLSAVTRSGEQFVQQWQQLFGMAIGVSMSQLSHGLPIFHERDGTAFSGCFDA